ncbi:MAG: PfkB family carbohydrate kinase [Bacteroidota bacterium]|nr:PfkB family carbohydrate kinase [Bacteroidota bacterium]
MLAIGECVYDIIFREGQPVAARAGGSMLNTAVSLGRTGLNPVLITETGNDKAGELVLDFLVKNGVDTQMIKQTPGRKTTISLAFLDEQGESTYAFYKDEDESIAARPEPHFRKDDVFLFGSLYSLENRNREFIVHILKKAASKSILCIYDPNIRKPHSNEMPALRGKILENIKMADIIRASDEDLQTAFSMKGPEAAAGLIRDSGKILIYTCNRHGLWLLGCGHEIFLPVPEIVVLSSIGAGDAFNAGLIYALEKSNISKNVLSVLPEEKWKDILLIAVSFAQNVCQSYDNYISVEFAGKLGSGR